MTGQYRKVRNYPKVTEEALDSLLPGWDDKTEAELTAYALCELLIVGKQMLQRNAPFGVESFVFDDKPD